MIIGSNCPDEQITISSDDGVDNLDTDPTIQYATSLIQLHLV